MLLCSSTKSIGRGERSELVRLKRRQPQIYPLLPAVAEALARYIDTVRPTSSCQDVFLCMQAPLRPLKAGSIFDVANRRFVSLGIEAAHRGGHPSARDGICRAGEQDCAIDGAETREPAHNPAHNCGPSAARWGRHQHDPRLARPRVFGHDACLRRGRHGNEGEGAGPGRYIRRPN